MLTHLEKFPLRLHLVVKLQFGIGLGLFDAVPDKSACNLVNNQSVDPLSLPFRFDADQVEIGQVVLPKSIQDIQKTQGKKPPAAFLERSRERRHCYPERDDLIARIQHQ